MHFIFTLYTLLTFSDALQVLKSLLMSGQVESGVLDEGDIAGVPLGQFLKPFQRHVLKCDAYKTYCMHAHSFKAALIAFLVTSWLDGRTDGITRTLHAHSFFRCLIWNDTGYNARRHLCAWFEERTLRAQYLLRTRAWRGGDVRVRV